MNQDAQATEESTSTDSFTYTITESFGGSWAGNPPIQLFVSQAGLRAIARRQPEPGSKVEIFSDPSKGIRSASPDRKFPVLRSHINSLQSLQVGDQLDFGWNSPRKIDYVSYSLIKGDRDEEIEGRMAVHHALAIELKLSRADPEDTQSPAFIHAVGTSDLWTIPELPYSWIPYTVPNPMSNAAIPLSETNLELSGFLLDHFSEQLQELGLMVRAEVTTEISVDYQNGNNPSPQRYELRVEASDVSTGSDDIGTEIPSLAVLSSDRYQMLTGMLRAAFSAGCMGDNVIGRLALSEISDDKNPITGNGRAEIVHAGGRDILVMKAVPSPDSGNPLTNCALVIFAGGSPTPGVYEIKSQGPDESINLANIVVAVLIETGKDELRTFTSLESGVMELSQAEDGLKGKLSGHGYRLMAPDRKTSELDEDVQVTLHFDIVQ